MAKEKVELTGNEHHAKGTRQHAQPGEKSGMDKAEERKRGDRQEKETKH